MMLEFATASKDALGKKLGDKKAMRSEYRELIG
jgi:hypothetical protein